MLFLKALDSSVVSKKSPVEGVRVGLDFETYIFALTPDPRGLSIFTIRYTMGFNTL